MLPLQNFYPNGFNMILPISGLQHASLQVAVPAMDAPASTSYAIPAATSYLTAQPETIVPEDGSYRGWLLAMV